MTYKVQFAPEARDQLADLEHHIAAASSLDIAARYVDAVVSYCAGLSDFPKRGRSRDDLLPGLRTTNFRGRTVISFFVDDVAQAVFIVGVFHGGQDYESR